MGVLEFDLTRTVPALIQGVFNRLATPLLRRIAKKERSVTLEALAASFEKKRPSRSLRT
ncbi:hypothetical protein [Mycetocola miduiensis]|uniref:hypothetical protein n=1 Tax=Mycetocola miduiensis TaxID=995034 RepID=UPI0015A61AB2|nr:hypothetical protein [Mycetocola miduiensis]